MGMSTKKDIVITADLCNYFSYADYHTDCLMKKTDGPKATDYSFINNIIITNNSDNDFDNLLISIKFSHNAFNIEDILVSKVPAKNQVLLDVGFMKVVKPLIDNLTESILASVSFTLKFNEEILDTNLYTFEILPVCQPSKRVVDDIRLYAKYITPLASQVKQLTLMAVSYNNNNSFNAYYKNVDGMLEEIKAIYETLHDYGIVYQLPPAGGIYESGKFVTQRIRTPEEVINDRKGTCLDLSLLFCSCLEEVGYHPIYIETQTHALVGVFLKKDLKFYNGVSKKIYNVLNSVGEGIHDIILIDTVCLTSDKKIPFSDALKSGYDHLKNYTKSYFAAVDIATCHKSIFSPIPVNNKDESLELLMTPKNLSYDELEHTDITYIELEGKEEIKDKFQIWEKKLLDLSEGNPLVNYKLKPSNTVKLVSNTKVYDLFSNNESLKLLLPTVANSKRYEYEINNMLESDVRANDIMQMEFDNDKLLAIGYEKTLKGLIKKSNSAMDETGAPTLYLCLGNLTYERKKKKGKGNAPFMVLPIKVTKDKLGLYYTVSYDYDDLMLNKTFFEYYKLEHPNADFSSLYSLGSNHRYIDIVHTFKKNNTEDIILNESMFYIANLSFAHYIMWLDMKKRRESLKQNKVVESILKDENKLNEVSDTIDKNADLIENYKDFAAPLPYDSTQLKAILDCGLGKSFILDGPPGTGKSQTIVNMIVNAFYHGKTVLFVAEKKAALDVVYDRLDKIELSRFCLELHSNKANKSDFFEKLKHSMELGSTKDPIIFDIKCEELEKKRLGLLEKINKMHENKYFQSLYDSIVKSEELSDIDGYIDLDEAYLINMNNEIKFKTYILIDKYIALANNINDYSNNPLRFIMLDNINYNDKELITLEFSKILKKYSELITDYNNLLVEVNFESHPSLVYIANVLELLNLCFNKDVFVDNLSEFVSNKEDKDNLKLFKKIEKLKEFEENYKDVFIFDSLLDIDADKIKDELNNCDKLFNKMLLKIKYKKLLKNITVNNHKVNSKKLITYFDNISYYNELIKHIKTNDKVINKMCGYKVLDNRNDITNIIDKYNNTRVFVNLINNLASYINYNKIIKFFSNVYKENDQYLKITFNRLYEKFIEYKELELDFNKQYKIDYKSILNVNNQVEEFKNLLIYAANSNHFSEMVTIAAITKVGNELSFLGLNDLYEISRSGKINHTLIKDLYDLSLAHGYIRLYFKDEDINYFVAEEYNAHIKKYKELINDYANLAIETVSAKLTANLNHQNINYANSSPIGRLKKSISNNGRGVTIRDTLLNYDGIIRSYFPCFLMSPLSAAQYLGVDEEHGDSVSKFDLVIFDEASQIPTHEAIGPIARGKSLIVAGDPEQMPPSAYFSAGIELKGEDIKFEDATSLLDECIAIELPRHRLSYHYRSKHESLISFSNHNFYDDNLYTFPSVDTANSRVEFRYVDLEKEKNKSKISSDEIKVILNTFKEIYDNPQTKNKSVGIIVFNMNQQEHVYDKLVDMISKDKKLSEAISKVEEEKGESWFVKSLENVQGDERDIIILSIGFGKNAAGRAKITGPLIRVNGQRRLNVAVTRSKEKMIVVSTVRYADFDEDTKINNQGIIMLKKFLKYSEEASFKACGALDEGKKSIVYYIKNDLEKLGYDVVTNVGNSEFRVDLAIKSKDGTYYRLGVLVDTKVIKDNISLRDKMYVQESVLNGLKWKIVSIYAIEYYKDKKATINKIIKALDEPYEKQDYELNPQIRKLVIDDVLYNTKEYIKSSNLPKVYYDNELGFDNSIYDIIPLIIQTESPVSFEIIKNTVRDNSNMSVFRDKAQKRLKAILDTFLSSSTVDQTQRFYWNKDDKELNYFRLASGRDLYDISKEEILACMIQVKNIQGDILKEDLYKLTLQAFDYGQSVLNSKNIDRLEFVYNWAKENNKI